MPSAPVFRDVTSPGESALRADDHGASRIVVIGIDRYRAWGRLHNAVSDALGALELFKQLGFEPVGRPLVDEAATGDAMRRLMTDDLATLGPSDSLVVFFAGHGHTVTRTYPGRTSVKTGYLVPVDGDQPGGRTGTWVRLDSWLSDAARLPIRHLLVFLDACHSGIALDPVIRWRGDEIAVGGPLDQLRARRSRRIITSALDDQRAMDSGPVPGHSLFTGCLIEALTGGIVPRTDDAFVTGTEIGGYVQRRVINYPSSNQTPDFGALELDDRGELVVQIPGAIGHRATAIAKPTGALVPPPESVFSPGAPFDANVSPAGPDGQRAHPRQKRSSVRHSAATTALRASAMTVIAGLAISTVVVSQRTPDAELSDPSVVGAASAPPRDAASDAPHHAPSVSGPGPVIDAGTLASTIAQNNPFLAIGALQVQAHQVTRREYAAYLTTLPESLRPQALPLEDWSEARPDEPVRWTRFEQATAFCAAIGARLPRFQEWQGASRGQWGIDPTGNHHIGPLREWTSERNGNFVRVAGATAAMNQTQRAKALSETFQLATADAFAPPAVPDENDVSGEEVGIRCVK